VRDEEVLGAMTQDTNAMERVHIEHVKIPHIILENPRLGQEMSMTPMKKRTRQNYCVDIGG
jgi:hypothetical protein